MGHYSLHTYDELDNGTCVCLCQIACEMYVKILCSLMFYKK